MHYLPWFGLRAMVVGVPGHTHLLFSSLVPLESYTYIYKGRLYMYAYSLVANREPSHIKNYVYKLSHIFLTLDVAKQNLLYC